MNRKPSKLVALLLIVCFMGYPLASYPLPEGADVQSGQASFSNPDANTLNIDQATDRLITNWQSFSIGAPEAVNFYQPSENSIALNRVVGVDPSSIMGKLTANGKIFLVNPNGILFGQGAQVNAAGLVASTLDISNDDFLAGRFTFVGKGGSIVNQGYISAPGGYVALLGSTVENTGIIEANLGSVVLAAGEEITLDLDPKGLMSVVISRAVSENIKQNEDAVKNSGKIMANGGRVILTAKTLDGIFKNAVNNEGVIEAHSLVNRKGEVYLLGTGENDGVVNTGLIDASAETSGADGGFVQLGGSRIDFERGIIDVNTIDGETGSILFDPPAYWAIGDLQEWYFNHILGDVNITIESLGNVDFIMGDFGGDDILDLVNLEHGSFNVNAGKSIRLNGDSVVTHGGAITLKADYPFWYQAGAAYPKQWTNTADGDGSIDLGGGALSSNGGAIILEAGKDIDLGSGSINSNGGAITLKADAGYAYDAHAQTDEGFWFFGWHPRIANGAPGNADTADGVGNINLGNGAGISSNGGAIALSGVDIALTALVDAATGTIDINAARDISATAGVQTSATINENAGRDLIMSGSSFVDGGQVNVGVGQNMKMKDSAAISGNTIDVDVTGELKMKDDAEISAQDSVDIDVGNLKMRGASTIEALNGVNINSAKDVIMRDSSSINSKAGTVDISAVNDVKMHDASSITAGDDVLITAGENVKVSNSSIWAGNDAIIYAGKDIFLGVIEALGKISLHADSGSIIDNNGDSLNLISPNLYLYAGKNIGINGKRIDTDTENVWRAVANNGDVLLNNKGGVTLWEVQALGSSIDIITGGTTYTYFLLALGHDNSDPAKISLLVNGGDLYVTAMIMASQLGDGNASISLNVNDGNINVDSASIVAMVAGSGDATVAMQARRDIVLKENSAVGAYVVDKGNAGISFDAGKSLKIRDSDVIAQTTEGDASITGNAQRDIKIKNSELYAGITKDGSVEIELNAHSRRGDIRVDDSILSALVGGSGKAKVNLKAGDDIRIDDSDLTAKVDGSGRAKVELTAGDDISVRDSDLIAKVGRYGRAGIELTSRYGDISIDDSDLIAKVRRSGSAEIELNARSRGGDIDIDDSLLLAKVGRNGEAEVELNAGGDIRIDDSDLIAKVGRYGRANIDLDARGDVRIDDSDLIAKVRKSGKAEIEVRAGDDINVHDSDLVAKVGKNGKAEVELTAGDDISVRDSDLIAKVGRYGRAGIELTSRYGDISIHDSDLIAKVRRSGSAEIELNARSHGGDIDIDDSLLLAKVGRNGEAEVELNAGDDIRIDPSTISAMVDGNGLALVKLIAGDDIRMDEKSTINALTGDGLSGVLLLAGDDIDNQGTISALSTDGFGGIALLAGGDIHTGTLIARGGDNAIPELAGILSSLMGQTAYIGSQYAYGSGVLINSFGGDITLGNISADAVMAAALFGNIYDEGDINAHYLGLLARYNIGDALNPINTNVDILSAYSWDEGDIYINEANDIELGLYLPISSSASGSPLIGALGLSVAANNGIIHITSGGDMIVNSVISPRGGVFLEATGYTDPILGFIPASIYAGRGWCPIVSQADINSVFAPGSFLNNLTGHALMGVGDTLWYSAAGIEYLSPIMIGSPDLPAGPNVIAGDYSYFSAPTGTIGVGMHNNPAVGVLDNPLTVNIQAPVIPGPHSALPVGIAPVAGLTLNMGGASATEIDTGDGNGPLGVSGVIQGIVRPGTTAVSDVNPSPAIVGSPSGYVFYDDTSTAYNNQCPGCNIPLDGSATLDAGLQQIWPKPVNNNLPLDLLNRLLALRDATYYRIYAEFMKNYRFVTIDTTTPHFYFYHPSTVSDYTAFDGINLDEGAYNFIDGVLNLKDKKGFNPYYQGRT